MTREQIQQTLRVSTLEGCLTQIYLNWSSGSVLTGFMLYLGAGPVALAAVASIPQLAQLLNPITSWIAAGARRRRGYIVWASAMGRACWLIPVFLPLILSPGREALAWMLVAVGLSSVVQNSAGLAWVSLMADVVPSDIRGRYFGMRTAIIGVVAMLTGLAAGWYLDRTAPPAGFQMVFIVGLLFAVAGLHCFRWYHEPETQEGRPSLKEAIALPLRDANFRRMLAFSMYWQGGVMLAAPFVIPYFLQVLQLTYTQVAIWAAIASTAALLTSPLWGYIGDRAGHRTVLSITTVLAGTVHPLCWMLATPGHLFFIWASGIVDALSWGGINPAMFNLSIATAPQARRLSYLAILSFANGLTGFLAALLSGPLLHLLLKYEFSVFGFHWTGFHSLFLISGVMRSTAWLLLARVDEPKAWPTLRLFKTIGTRGIAFVMRPFARETT